MYVIKVLVCDDKNAKQNICSITNSLKIYKGLYSSWEKNNIHKFYKQSFSSSLIELLLQRIFPEIPGKALVFLSSESEGKQVWYPRYLAVISDDYELVKPAGRHLTSIKVCNLKDAALSKTPHCLLTEAEFMSSVNSYWATIMYLAYSEHWNSVVIKTDKNPCLQRLSTLVQRVGFDAWVIISEITLLWDACVLDQCFPIKNQCTVEVLPQLMDKVS